MQLQLRATKGVTFRRACSYSFRAWAVTDYSCRYATGVLDRGSERMFAAEALSRHLKLRCIGFATISTNTFANVSSCTPKRLHIVERHLRNQHSNVEVTLRAIEIPPIRQDISAGTMTSSFVTSFRKTRHDIAYDLIHPSIERKRNKCADDSEQM